MIFSVLQVRGGSVYVSINDTAKHVTSAIATSNITEKKKRSNKYTVAVGTTHGHSKYIYQLYVNCVLLFYFVLIFCCLLFKVNNALKIFYVLLCRTTQIAREPIHHPHFMGYNFSISSKGSFICIIPLLQQSWSTGLNEKYLN